MVVLLVVLVVLVVLTSGTTTSGLVDTPNPSHAGAPALFTWHGGIVGVGSGGGSWWWW